MMWLPMHFTKVKGQQRWCYHDNLVSHVTLWYLLKAHLSKCLVVGLVVCFSPFLNLEQKWLSCLYVS